MGHTTTLNLPPCYQSFLLVLNKHTPDTSPGVQLKRVLSKPLKRTEKELKGPQSPGRSVFAEIVSDGCGIGDIMKDWDCFDMGP
jgi:hypothetical protein